MASFSRLIRFKDNTGEIHYGQAPAGLNSEQKLLGIQVKTYTGNPLESHASASLSGEEKKVVEILSPIPSTPIIYGVGLNYRKHAQEGGVS
jgi:2-keto-4-pentenoate hydratase/2-oxohepta-3-ene-1,7-dioic acid hydratase in catechol pathway